MLPVANETERAEKELASLPEAETVTFPLKDNEVNSAKQS
jgi:hypothetical protein